MPSSYDVTPTKITHHPTQRIDPVPGRLPDITPQDLVNGFAKAMKMLTGVDITSSTAFFVWLKEATGLDFVILGRIIDAITDLLGIDPDNPVDVEAQWAKIKDQYLDPISDFLTPDSPLNGGNLFGLLDIPFVMLRNSNQELLDNPTFFGELSVGNRRRWSHVTNVYRNDQDPPGAETVVCNGEVTALRSNRGKVAEGQMIVGEIHVLGDQVTGTAGADRVRLQLVSYLNGVRVGTPVTVGLTSFTQDPAGAGWVGAPGTALAGRLEVDWTVPAGVDEVELRTEVTAAATSGRVTVDSGSLQRGFNWNRVERDLQGMLGILDGIADPDHWEAAYLGLKDLLSLVGIDTSGWVTSTAFDFWRDFNADTAAIVRVFAHMGSVVAWENAWDGLRSLAGLIGIDTSAWPADLDPGGLIITFATLVTAGNAMFKDLGNKAKWTVAWNALTAFIDKLLGTGTITWPVLEPGGWFVDALGFVQNLIGQNGKDDLFPKGAGGVAGQVPTGLSYEALLDLGGQLPSGNLYYCVTAVVSGAETPASAEVMYFGAGLGTVGMKIKLTWSAFSGASQYKVYRRVRSNLAGDVETRLIGTVVGTTFTDQTVRAGGSAATPPLSIDVAAQAAAEAAAEAAAAANNALVTNADTTVPNAPTWGFLQGVIAEVTSSANSVPYPGFLELPIFYYYTVTAVTAGGKESVASAEKMVMISPLCPAQVKVIWTASTTPSTTYRVYRRSSKTGATLRVATGVTGTTFTDTASSGTTVAKPGTTTAVAGSAVASAVSTANIADANAGLAQSATQATNAAIVAAAGGSGNTPAAVQAALQNIPAANIVVHNPTAEFYVDYGGYYPFQKGVLGASTANVSINDGVAVSNCTIILMLGVVDSYPPNSGPSIPAVNLNGYTQWTVTPMTVQQLDDNHTVVYTYRCTIGSTAQAPGFRILLTPSGRDGKSWFVCGVRVSSNSPVFSFTPRTGPGVGALYLSATGGSMLAFPSAFTQLNSTTISGWSATGVTLGYASGLSSAPTGSGFGVYTTPVVGITNAAGVGAANNPGAGVSISSSSVSASGTTYTVPYSGFYIGSVSAGYDVSLVISSTSQNIPLTTSGSVSGSVAFYAQAGDTVTFTGGGYTCVALASRSDL